MIMQIKWDWSISLGQVIPVIVLVVGGVSAWYGVKSDVANQNIRISHLEENAAMQRHVDELQDAARQQANQDLKDQIRDFRTDVTSEIRDLRRELRGGSIQRPSQRGPNTERLVP